jgi:hypothetical protein
VLLINSERLLGVGYLKGKLNLIKIVGLSILGLLIITIIVEIELRIGINLIICDARLLCYWVCLQAGLVD